MISAVFIEDMGSASLLGLGGAPGDAPMMALPVKHIRLSRCDGASMLKQLGASPRTGVKIDKSQHHVHAARS